jgi:hypothetical protein
MKKFIPICFALLLFMGCQTQEKGLTYEQAQILQKGFDQYYQMQRDIYNRPPIILTPQQNNYWQEEYYRRKALRGY